MFCVQRGGTIIGAGQRCVGVCHHPFFDQEYRPKINPRASVPSAHS